MSKKLKPEQKKLLIAGGLILAAGAAVYFISKQGSGGSSATARQQTLLAIAAKMQSNGWPVANVQKAIAAISALPDDQFNQFASFLLQYHFANKVAPPELNLLGNQIINAGHFWPGT